MKILGCLLLLASVGCSSTREIAKAQLSIVELAGDTKEIAETVVGNEEQKEAIITHQNEIIRQANVSLQELQSVEDKIPWWANLLNNGMLVLSILGIAFLLWYLGIGTVVRNALYSLGLFIPKAKQQEAKLLKEALDPDNPTELREYISAKRARDPAFDAAYKKGSKK